jgi:hypothetical protein
VAKSNAVACLHSEEGIVLAFSGRSGEFKSPNVIVTGLYLLADLNGFELHIITTSLN